MNWEIDWGPQEEIVFGYEFDWILAVAIEQWLGEPPHWPDADNQEWR